VWRTFTEKAAETPLPVSRVVNAGLAAVHKDANTASIPSAVIPGRIEDASPESIPPSNTAAQWILRCTIVHHSSMLAHRPGMTSGYSFAFSRHNLPEL
jgi:hypothetical protein